MAFSLAGDVPAKIENQVSILQDSSSMARNPVSNQDIKNGRVVVFSDADAPRLDPSL